MALQLGAWRDALVQAGASDERPARPPRSWPVTSVNSLTSSPICAS